MRKRICLRVLNLESDNLKPKTCPELSRRIQNPKWAGFLAILVLLVGSVALAEAQQPAKVPRIGYISGSSLSALSERTEAFRLGLRELGYLDGKNIVIEYRWGEGNDDRLPALVAELVRLKVDVIVTGGPTLTRLAKDATKTIPIVMAQDSDPVGNGFVASLARPGGNITGLSNFSSDISGKQLELLKETVPRLSRLALLGTSTEPGNPQAVRETEVTAGAFGMRIQYLDVLSSTDIETAFRAARKERADGVLVLASSVFNFHRTPLIEIAVKSRLPTIYPQSEYVDAGGLMAHGPNRADLYRRAATYVDKILKGAKPAELPVEQPTKFEFLINLKSAKQIGLTIPPNVLARADKVIR
jgi:putative ABC transport system substrate-binding protein